MSKTATPCEARRKNLPFRWPAPSLRITLVEPEIPPNTGNIARLCAATGTPLHLIEPLGFRLTDRAVRRAGLDYWDAVEVRRHVSFEAWRREFPSQRMWMFSTAAERSLYDADFRPGDALVFGCETRGLPDSLLAAHPDRVVGIPMKPGAVRSLNLADCVAIALFEALRQIQSERRV